MRLLGVLTLCGALCCAHASAQEANVGPGASALVDCGPDQAVIFAGTESPAGDLALGWTLRPNRNRTPVDWSSFQPNDPYAFLDKYPIGPDLDPGDYALIDGLIDRRAKKFTPLASKFPYFPNKNHGAFHVMWSDAQREPRFAVVNNDARFFTVNLWLVAIDERGVRATDLMPAAEKPVRAYLRTRGARRSVDYAIVFGADGSPNDPAAPKPFARRTVRIPFTAGIPKSVDDPAIVGGVTVALPTGKILRVTGRPER